MIDRFFLADYTIIMPSSSTSDDYGKVFKIANKFGYSPSTFCKDKMRDGACAEIGNLVFTGGTYICSNGRMVLFDDMVMTYSSLINLKYSINRICNET